MPESLPEPFSGSEPRLFPLGRILATPGAVSQLEEAGQSPHEYLRRHAAGDWGDLDPQDQAANDRALSEGGRLFSAYTLPTDDRLWVITEADRTVTTLLTPMEY